MPAPSILFVPGVNMEAAYVVSASSEASGHLKENALDWNPDTYWAMAAVGTNEIVIDLGSAKTIDRAVVFINNYNVNLNPHGTQYLKVYYSSNGSSWSQWAGSVSLPTDGTTQFVLSDVQGASQSARYWKIELVCPEQILEVRHVYLCSVYNITQGNQYPELDAQRYNVERYESSSGRVFTNLLSYHERHTYQRTYLFATQGDWESLPLKLAWKACRGDWMPLVTYEDSTYRLVRFAAGELQKNAEAYQVYRPTVTFITEPFIEAGKTV